MAAQENLTDMIETLIKERTFSLDGVTAIERLRTRAAELQDSLNDEQQRRKASDEKVQHYVNQCAANTKTIADWAMREAAITSREKGMTALEQAKAVAEAATGVFRECFGLVFRNTEIRQSMFGMAPNASPGAPGYGQPPTTVSVSESKTTQAT